MKLPVAPFAAVLLLAALAALGGCEKYFTHDVTINSPRPRLVPMAPDPAELARNLYKLQLIYVTEQLGPDDPPNDFWRFLDETVVPSAERRTLAANGFRLAAGGDLAIDRLNRVLPLAKGLTVRQSPPIYARQGYTLDVPLGGPEGDVTILLAQPDGSLSGMDFPKAASSLRFTCRAAPEPDACDVTVTERILYGAPQPTYRTMPSGLPLLVNAQPIFGFNDLRTTVRLRGGQILAVGLQGDRPLSIGEHLLLVRDELSRQVTTIILLPELVAPGAVPSGVVVAGSNPPVPAAPGAPGLEKGP
jgi:hypothetical protein